jgi:hypothetical protein
MCRLLIYIPSDTRYLEAAPQAHLLKLGPVERDYEELMAGILWGEAEHHPPLAVTDALKMSGAERATLPDGFSSSPQMAVGFWQALALVADYGRLVLVRDGEQLAVYQYQPPGGAEVVAVGDGLGFGEGYLYHPHPAVLVSGRYCEVFAPTNPDAVICACSLGEEVFWGDEERGQTESFRREVLAALALVTAQAEVTFIDSDGWYAEW